ncbi:pentapeptide repeat-containing protein [Methanotorris igneus]|uniref:Pentapeptide repeat protein n=1 Tax=Methanotorris igneus (strain DSM 5666 / JCM 11834 / Kol 5) TaxID=880724 RepID=F6BAP6_METIK|nr:pentapeptide repeat-containing protein [Methanotorris igneus]AEF95860.1 hypothetical protein Metig_0304 [Methanotorris igneus Kol 5]
MEKEVITNKEFIDKFVECLKKGKNFKLENCIIEGDVDIRDIYNRIKDDEKLKKLISEQKDKESAIVDKNVITINAGINLSFHNVEFNGNFQMFNNKIETVETIKKIPIKILLEDVNFIESTFKGKVDFSCSEIQGEVNIIDSTFMEDVIFRKSTFKKDVYFEKSDTSEDNLSISSKFKNNLVIKGEINFTDSIFEKNVYFMGLIVFKKKVNFNNSTFKGNVYFENLVFEKILDFSSSTFKGKINFEKLVFKENVYFNGSTFEKDANFSSSVFKEYIDFRGLTFENDVAFMDLTFEKVCIFYDTTFKGKVDFSNTVFKNTVAFTSIFKEKTFFRNSKFKKELVFINTIFEGEPIFLESIINKAKFFNATFKSRADFREICFVLLSFVDCTFEDLALFRKGKIKFEKYKRNNISLEKPNDQWMHTIINIIKDECLAIFLNVQFLNKHTKIENFSLSKTSFLKTDVREVMLLCDIKKEEILSHKLNKRIYEEAYNILKNHLGYKSILAEYRNLRISIENNRTYEEASDLYKMEMEFKKKYSKNDFEKGVIWLYGAISDYGESIFLPIFWLVLLIFTTPFVLTLVHYFNSFINTQIPNRIPEFLLLYVEYLKSVLGAKFYTGNSKSLLEIIIYCLYSVF